MRHLKTTEAATLLSVSPNTLRAWERKFGFPMPQRSPGGHRVYTHGELVALRDALEEGLSISAAILRARASLQADTTSLVRALLDYDGHAADRAVERTLALRSVERSVEDVLLPSLEDIVARAGPDSALWAFAARWAIGWLKRARRLARPPDGRLSVMVGHASCEELDLDAPYVRALELFCLRAGVKVLSLPARIGSGLGDAAAAHRPQLIVLAGAQLPDGIAAQWSSLITRTVGPTPFLFYRPPSSPASSMVLPPSPGEAQLRLVELARAAAAPTASFATRHQARVIAAA